MKEIHLKWHGPYSLEYARNGEPGQTFGLYQYMGMHDVYGPSTLLYLGRASDAQIGNRLAGHVHHSWSSLPVEILIGNIATEDQLGNNLGDNERSEQIKLAERLLIYTHSPAWNSSNVKSLYWPSIPEDLHIFNWGVRGRLLPEVSAKRWREVGNALPKGLTVQE